MFLDHRFEIEPRRIKKGANQQLFNITLLTRLSFEVIVFQKERSVSALLLVVLHKLYFMVVLPIVFIAFTQRKFHISCKHNLIFQIPSTLTTFAQIPTLLFHSNISKQQN